MTAGVYAIRNRVSGRLYIGSAFNIARRWQGHRARLLLGAHSSELQKDWNFYGEDGFLVDHLEVVKASSAALLEAEQRWIDMIVSERGKDALYNQDLSARRPGKSDEPVLHTSPDRPNLGVLERIEMMGYRCQRCGHVWVPMKSATAPPRVCPKCKSPYWDRPRVRHPRGKP